MTLLEKNDCLVGVLYGGISAEREVSLMSGAAVILGLRNKGYNVVGIDPAEENFIEQLEPVSHVFVALHGPGGEDGSMQGFLQVLGKTYTGSKVAASAIAMDKLITKKLWISKGLPTPAFIELHCESDIDACELPYPLFVKPVTEGSSIGMAKVSDKQELHSAYKVASNYNHDVIAEVEVVGAEFTVAILSGLALPPIRLETDHKFYDYDAKYLAEDTRYLCPCGLSEEKEKELKVLAVTAFNTVGCEGWGRVDVMQDETGNFYLLEVNTVPGMTSHSLVPMAAKAQGIDFNDLVAAILEDSILGGGVLESDILEKSISEVLV